MDEAFSTRFSDAKADPAIVTLRPEEFRPPVARGSLAQTEPSIRLSNRKFSSAQFESGGKFYAHSIPVVSTVFSPHFCRMDIPLGLRTAVASLDGAIDVDHPDGAIECLHNYFGKLKPSVVNANSPDFSMPVFEYTLREIMPYLSFQNATFLVELDRYLRHWISQAVCFCPMEFLQLLERLFEEGVKPSYSDYFVGAYAQIMEKLPREMQEKKLPLFQRYLLSSPISVVAHVPSAIWRLMLDTCSEEDVTAVLMYLLKSYSIEPALVLTRKNSQVRIPLVVLSVDLEYVCRFLKATKGYLNFDVVPLIGRCVDTLNGKPSLEQRYAIQIIDRLLNNANEENKDVFQPAWSLIKEKLDNHDWKYRTEAFKCLVKAEKFGLFSYDVLAEYFDQEMDRSQKYVMRAMINHIDREDVQEQLLNLFIEVTKTREPAHLASAIHSFTVKYEELNTASPEKTKRIMERLCTPLHPSPGVQDALAAMFITLPARKDMVQRVHQFVNFCAKFDKSDELVDMLGQLIEKYQLSFDYARLDWFGPGAASNLLLVPDDDPMFNLEILTYNLVSPTKSLATLKKLAKCKGNEANEVFTELVSILVSVASVVGADVTNQISKAGIKFDGRASSWFDKSEIEKLFNETVVPLSDSGCLLGSFIRELVEAIASLMPNVDTISDDACGILLLLCGALVSPFSGPVASLFAALKGRATGKNEEKYSKQVSSFFNQFLSMVDSPEIAKAIVSIFGEDEAIQKYRSIIVEAMGKDVEIAKQLESKVDQPLPAMPTFVYFTSEKHKEWAASCRRVFEFNDWVVLRADYALAGEVPEIGSVYYLDSLHKKIYNKLSLTVEQFGLDILSIPDFRPKPVMNLKEGLRFRESDERTSLYQTITYLWHTTEDLVPALTLEVVQEYALKYSADPRIVIGFMTWAKRKSWKIDVDAWMATLKVKYGDDNSIYAAALLLECIPKATKVQPKVKEFIERAFEAIGIYHITPDEILKAYYNRLEMERQLIHAAMAHDVHAYSAIDPLIIADFEGDDRQPAVIAFAMKLLNHANINIKTVSRITSAFADAFMTNYSELKLRRFLPTNYQHDYRIMSYADTTQMQKPLVFGSGVIDGLIVAFKNCQTISDNMITFMVNVATTPEQYSMICNFINRHFKRGREYMRYFMDNRDEFYSLNEMVKGWIMHKPPSYCRGMFRALWKTWKADVEERNVQGIRNVLNVNPNHFVHPALCYSRMGKAGMDPWDNATTVTKLSLGIVDKECLLQAYQDMGVVSEEAIDEFVYVAAMNDKTAQLSGKWTTTEDMRKEFMERLLKTAVAQESYVEFTDRVFKVVSEKVRLQELANVATEPSFLAAGKFGCSTLLFRKIEQLLIKAEAEEHLAKCVKLHNPSLNLMGDAKKTEVFTNPNDPKLVALSLKDTDDRK